MKYYSATKGNETLSQATMWVNLENIMLGTSLVVQWLRLWASNAGGSGLIPGWGTKILHAMKYDQKKEKENIMLSEGSQIKKATYCMTPFTWNAQNKQIYKDRK